MSKTAPQDVPRATYAFAAGRVGPLVEQALETRARAARWNHRASDCPGLIGAPSDTDLAVAAYLQGLTDVVQLLHDRGAITQADVDALSPTSR